MPQCSLHTSDLCLHNFSYTKKNKHSRFEERYPLAIAKLTTNPERNIGMIKVPLAGFCEGFLCFLRGNEIVFILF